jgi:hypothetical protein
MREKGSVPPFVAERRPVTTATRPLPPAWSRASLVRSCANSPRRVRRSRPSPARCRAGRRSIRFLPVYLGAKKRSGSDVMSACCAPGAPLPFIVMPSDDFITNSLSRTRNAGAAWPPNGFSSVSGNARQIRRNRSSPAWWTWLGPCRDHRVRVGPCARSWSRLLNSVVGSPGHFHRPDPGAGGVAEPLRNRRSAADPPPGITGRLADR